MFVVILFVKTFYLVISLFCLCLALIMGANSADRFYATVQSASAEQSELLNNCAVFGDEEAEGEEDCGENSTTQHHRTHPIPILGHLLGGVLMMFAAIVNLNPGLLKRAPRLHRASGYCFIVGSLVAGASAVWLTATFPERFPGLNIFSNFLWGTLLIVCPIMALRAIKKRNIPQHKAWMIRGFAVAAGPAMHRVLFFAYMLPLPEYVDIDFILSTLTVLVAELLFVRRITRGQRKPARQHSASAVNTHSSRSGS